MKHKKLLCVAVVLCMTALSGCSKGEKENDYITFKKVPINDEGNNGSKSENSSKDSSENQSEGNDADSLIYNSDVMGSVVEFSNTGCTVSPTKTEEVDGGQLAIAAQPGYEDEENNVNIHYSDSCQFQLAKINIATGKADISDVDVSEIKKQTSLIIYGEWSDDHNIEATKVIIDRYEYE
ncbi:MAG: hypothetical protein K2I03_00920 [Lachnospiraceae bacterium]|nr:hypothetical protein [Lachnospiraceae bacterium]MDE6232038.1 hypothetical protein [Lachnospiraceae bacterium]MDE6253408.1 hypothetical protein [Lachnospiraceae bacterium]